MHPDGATGVVFKTGDLVATLTTDKNGEAEVNNLYLGNYYVKEITPSEGYLLDEEEHDVVCDYEGDLVAEVSRSTTSAEQVIKQPFQLIKVSDNGDDTEAGLLAGAEFTAYLKSSLPVKADGSYDFDKATPVVIGENGATTITSDDKGHAVSIAIPYGTYVVVESKTPHNMKTIKPFEVKISENHPDKPQTWRVFLMDVVQSDFAFMPNKLDLIRDIALGTDNAERKAYSNNKYGLVEYSIRSGYVKISYKNRNGVRKEGALDWRELYEILSYMVKQPFYCGEDQKKYYQETKQKADRDKMNPVYKRFFDIEDSVKANRLETRERAIANGWDTKIDENGHVVSDDAVSVSVDDIQADTESQETVDFTPKQEPVQQVESLENEKNVAGQTKHNFHYNLWEMEKGGPKTRYQWNMDAIRTLKQIELENRLATPEEQKTLSKFVGWGGLSQAFDENNAGWSKEYAELKDLLSDEEYSAARATVNNAFYTSPEIAMCINSALVQFGFRGGNVLEPSMGIGNFFGSMPAPMQRSKLYGVELDSISGRIAKQLYQNANISITGFENTTYPDNFFDVVVGNVPFGDYKVFDPKYNKYNFRIHDYFLAKALDQVRPGGMVAVITTKGTLDKANPTIRKYLAERAELVGAVRLPNTAFKDNAGTEVTADILFLQKRERKIDIEPDWVHLGVTENGIAVNSYFAEHPEMMLGSMEYDTRIYGQDSRYTVCVNNDENFNMYETLNKATNIAILENKDKGELFVSMPRYRSNERDERGF